jgi:hypothetical protein
MWRWMLTSRYALTNLVIAAFAIFVIFNVVRGGEERGEPRSLQRSSSGDEFRISKPISASQYVEIDDRPYLLLMAKRDNEHIETADLRIISVDPAEDLEQAGWIHTSMSIQRPTEALAYARGHAYVGLTREGTERPALWVVDLSNPNRPFEANLLPAEMPIRSLAASEDGYMVAAGFDDQFLVYDLSQPNEPEVIGSFHQSVAVALTLSLERDNLFVDHMAGVINLDMTDLPDPARIHEFAHPGWQEPDYVPEPEAFLLGDEGFEFNIPPASFLDMAVSPALIALAAGDDGFLLFERSDGREVGRTNGPRLDGRVARVALDGQTLYVLAARLQDEPTARFTAYEINISRLDGPVVVEPSGRYSGIPRYQDIIAHDGNVWVLFNDTVIRFRAPAQ